MSWYRGKKGRGTDVAAWTAGAFAEERGQLHSEETRQLLEAHERVLHVFALLHHEDLIEVSSSGHFDGPRTRYTGAGQSQLQTRIVRLGMPASLGEPDDERTERLLGEAVTTQKTLTDAHSPRVIHGVTTPITPAEESEDAEAQEGDKEGEELLVLKPGAGLLPPSGEGPESEEEMKGA